MSLEQDETRVLHDAFRLGRQNLDYCETEDWEAAVVDRLVARGIMQISIAGRILEERSFRITRTGMAKAEACHDAFEAGLIGMASAVAVAHVA